MNRRTHVVAALVAALFAVATGVAVSSPDPAASTDRPSPGGHRFVFDDGKVRYEGDALRTTNLVEHLNRAQTANATPHDAVDALFLDSLVGLGALTSEVADVLDRSIGEDPKVGPWMLPAGDFDGDGNVDLIGQTVRWYGSGPDQLQVAGVRGVDGAVLWDRTFVGSRVAAVPAVVEGEAGALVLAYDARATYLEAVVAAAGDWTVSVVVTALDKAGQTAWTREWSGAFRVVEAYGFVTYAYAFEATDFPYAIDTMTADDNPDTDVLIGQDTVSGVCAVVCTSSEASMTATVVRGGADSPSGPEFARSGTELPTAYVGPDLFGHGHDSVLFTEDEATGTGVAAADPYQNPRVVWEVDGLPYGFYAPFSAGRLSGRTGVDLVMWSPYSYYGSPSVALRGDDGAPLWAKRVGFPIPLAGAGPNGTDALGSVDVYSDYETSRAVVAYSAVDAVGTELYRKAYSVPRDPYGYPVVAVYPDLGDLDGDGVTDSGHRLAAADYANETFVKDSGAVSGRTGDKLWSGVPGRALRGPGANDLASVEFVGRDLRVTRVAGATGFARWTATTSGDMYAIDGHDVTGDGVVDVVLSAGLWLDGNDYESYWSIDGEPVVLDGVTGQRLWALSDLPEAMAEPRTETKPYVGPPTVWNSGPLPGGLVNDCTGSEQSLSGTCFQLNGDERTVSLAVDDAVSENVSGIWHFTDDTNPLAYGYSEGSFCGSVADVPVPPGAKLLWVFVFADTACSDSGPPTTGTITASFA